MALVPTLRSTTLSASGSPNVSYVVSSVDCPALVAGTVNITVSNASGNGFIPNKSEVIGFQRLTSGGTPGSSVIFNLGVAPAPGFTGVAGTVVSSNAGDTSIYRMWYQTPESLGGSGLTLF